LKLGGSKTYTTSSQAVAQAIGGGKPILAPREPGEPLDDDDDDDDFKKNGACDYEKMCLDNLLEGVSATGGVAGFDDGDMLEEDDEVRDDEEDIMIEGEEDYVIDEEEDPKGERTTKSESINGLGKADRKQFMDAPENSGEHTGSAIRDKGFRI